MTPLEVRRHELERRCRLAYLAGAEERSRAERGRGLTRAQLRLVMLRYPGDPMASTPSRP